MTGTDFNLDAADIAKATGCPAANVSRFWPGIQAACVENGLTDRASIIAVLATIATEVASFEPINEFGDDAYFTKHYEGKKELGNLQPGDGVRFHGRGFIQVTGRANYRGYGQKLGVALEDQPELALDPNVATRILGCYFKDHGIGDSARRGDWKEVRKKVNGGLNGWDRFNALVDRLEQATQAKGEALAEGSIGPGVLALKALLNAWGKTHPLPKPMKPGPYFGPATTAAVKAFQNAHGIQATGRVGAKTRTALEAAARPTIVHRPPSGHDAARAT
jgi:predicted chitinase